MQLVTTTNAQTSVQ